MKIRTKSGEVLDLAEVRAFIAEGNRRAEEAWVHIEVLNDYVATLLNALEAALAAPAESDETRDMAIQIEKDRTSFYAAGWVNGTQTMRKRVREAAGVVEEPEATS